jgi:hypothetical protein
MRPAGEEQSGTGQTPADARGRRTAARPASERGNAGEGTR